MAIAELLHHRCRQRTALRFRVFHCDQAHIRDRLLGWIGHMHNDHVMPLRQMRQWHLPACPADEVRGQRTPHCVASAWRRPVAAIPPAASGQQCPAPGDAASGAADGADGDGRCPAARSCPRLSYEQGPVRLPCRDGRRAMVATKRTVTSRLLSRSEPKFAEGLSQRGNHAFMSRSLPRTGCKWGGSSAR